MYDLSGGVRHFSDVCNFHLYTKVEPGGQLKGDRKIFYGFCFVLRGRTGGIPTAYYEIRRELCLKFDTRDQGTVASHIEASDAIFYLCEDRFYKVLENFDTYAGCIGCCMYVWYTSLRGKSLQRYCLLSAHWG